MSDEALINTLVLTWRREQRLVRVLDNGLRLTQFALLAGYLFFAIIQKRMDPFYFLMHLFIVVTGASQFMVLAWAAGSVAPVLAANRPLAGFIRPISPSSGPKGKSPKGGGKRLCGGPPTAAATWAAGGPSPGRKGKGKRGCCGCCCC